MIEMYLLSDGGLREREEKAAGMFLKMFTRKNSMGTKIMKCYVDRNL